MIRRCEPRLREGPRLITWVIRTADIVAAVEAAAIPLGTITRVSRGALSWRLTVPDDGHMPGGGTIPHVIEWDDGLRPWEQMADLGCSLAALTLADPDGDWLNDVLRSLGAEALPFVKALEGGPPRLSAKIVTPSGRIYLTRRFSPHASEDHSPIQSSPRKRGPE